MKEWTGAYVCHVCKDCKSAFVAENYTNAQNEPPKWRYCPKCAAKRGIDYATQTPRKNRTPEENERYKKLGEIGKQNLKNYLGKNPTDGE